MGDIRATACITFDFDTFSGWVFGAGGKPLKPMHASKGEFGGRVGVGRILDLLDRYGVRGTFYIPGMSADSWPHMVEEIVKRGHEVGHHGYCHETPTAIDLERERVEFEMGIETIKRLTGKAPAGYRAPAWDPGLDTLTLVKEYGFKYDSSLMGDDFRPYWMRLGDHGDKRSAWVFGEETDIVEIPISWVLDDWGYYEFSPGVSDGGNTADHVLEIWQGEFDFMYEHEPGGVFTLTMHPQVTGRGSRLTALERLLQRIRSLPDTRFATTGEVAEEWRSAQAS
jgi:peptidoglycan/xylan/chitin deacetylase (PgdA/CDA1 family)